MNTRKGISPILATVIIIAVTLVIAIGVIGWIMGIWGGFGSTESLQIYPDSKLQSGSTVTLTLHIKNTGTATAIIKKVEIVGADCTADGLSQSVSPGQELTGWQLTNATGGDLTGTCDITAGATYQIKVYTDAGNVYTAVIRAD